VTLELISVVETEANDVTGFRCVPLAYEATGSQHRRAAIPGAMLTQWYVLGMLPSQSPRDLMVSAIRNASRGTELLQGGSIMRAVLEYVARLNTAAQLTFSGHPESAPTFVIKHEASSDWLPPIRGLETGEAPRLLTAEEVSVPSRLAFIREQLSLNISHLASILGVGRKAIYAWIEGSANPRTEHQRRIKDAYDVARIWSQLSNVAVGDLLQVPVTDGSSLLDVLRSSPLDSAHAQSIMLDLRASVQRREMESIPWPASPAEIARERGVQLPNEEARRRNIDAAVLRARAARS